MLPDPIGRELFNPYYKNTDVSIDYICDDVSSRGYVVCEVHDYDSSVIMELFAPRSSSPTVRRLRIDRINECLEIYEGDSVKFKGGYDRVMQMLSELLMEEGPEGKLSQSAFVIKQLIDGKTMRLNEIVNMIRGEAKDPLSVDPQAILNFLYELESRGFGTVGPGSDPTYTPA